MTKKILLLLFIFIALSAKAQSWTALGTGTSAINPATLGEIHSIVSGTDGIVYAAGYFKNSAGYYYVAKWDGTSWSELGSGSESLKANQIINQICMDPSGNLYAAGVFTNSTGAFYVAKWDGTTWSELGTGSNALNASAGIGSICSDADGNIYAAGAFPNAGGKFYVAKWDGTTWAELGTGSQALNANNIIWYITADGDGNVYAAGNFTNASGYRYVAKWDGTTWAELGAGSNALKANYFIYALYADASGNMYAAGGFTDNYIEMDFTNLVMKWDGTSWSKLGLAPNDLNATGAILSMIGDNDGNLYVAGLFSNSNAERYVAKWNGNTWSELGASTNNYLHANGYINSLCTDADGNIYAAGNFKDVNSKQYVAQFSTSTVTATEDPTDRSLAIYPNPTTGLLYINNAYEGTAHIYNYLGELILTQFIHSENMRIDLTDAEAGIYTVVLTSDDHSYSPIKIVKN